MAVCSMEKDGAENLTACSDNNGSTSSGTTNNHVPSDLLRLSCYTLQ